MNHYLFIAVCTEPWSVPVRCRLLAGSSVIYSQSRQHLSPPVVGWPPEAQAAFTRHAQRDGTRRLRAELRAEGPAVSRYALCSWLHCNGLRAKSTSLRSPRTRIADPAVGVVENRLLGRSAPTAPDQVWVGNSTYAPVVSGPWCYLTTWRDACSLSVVGGHLVA